MPGFETVHVAGGGEWSWDSAVALGTSLGEAEVLGPDCGCTSTSLRMWMKWHRTVHRPVCVTSHVGHSTVIMQVVTSGRNHWVKGTQDVSVFANLKSFQNKKLQNGS